MMNAHLPHHLNQYVEHQKITIPITTATPITTASNMNYACVTVASTIIHIVGIIYASTDWFHNHCLTFTVFSTGRMREIPYAARCSKCNQQPVPT